MVGDRRVVRGGVAAGDDRGDLPDDPDASGDHGAGRGHGGGPTRRRFVLGVGSGEALNEHILGDRWPSAGVRLEMLEEAVQVIRAAARGERGQLPRPSTTRCRTPASRPFPGSRSRSTSPGSGRRPSSWRPASATASAPSPRTPRPCPPTGSRWRVAAGAGGMKVCVAETEERRRDGPRAGPTTYCRASSPRSCRGRGTSRPPPRWSSGTRSARRSPAGRTRRRHIDAAQAVRRRRLRRGVLSSRSGASTRSSSSCGRTRCCRRCDEAHRSTGMSGRGAGLLLCARRRRRADDGGCEQHGGTMSAGLGKELTDRERRRRTA